jgi:hypothetical protein
LFKSFACLVVIFWSPWISLTERSRSNLLLWFFLCIGEELFPLLGDANEGCQWEIQTNEGWTPY